MPFTMTHLIITKNLSEVFADHIGNLPQFYLGSVAPDAVHNRTNYISDFKKESHLCVGNEIWGMLTNNDEWKENVLAFYNRHKNSEHHDFILGYCCHILSDLYNNINVWIPFKQKYAGEIEKNNLYHHENNRMDIELALTYEGRDDFWLNLMKSNSFNFFNLIYAAELDKQKDNIFNVWFKDKERPDISYHKVITYESTMNFINNATDFIILNFREHFC